MKTLPIVFLSLLAVLLSPSAALAQPAITGISPTSGARGTTVPLTINGNNLNLVTSVQVRSSDDIQVSAATFAISANRTNAYIFGILTIPSSVPAGQINIHILEGGADKGAALFTVTPGQTPSPTPTPPPGGGGTGGTGAAGGTQECVKLRRDIKFAGSNCNSPASGVTANPTDVCGKGDVVGAPNGFCEILTDDFLPTASAPTGFTLDDGTAVKVWVTEKWGVIGIINIIQTIVDWVFAFLVVFAILYVILGAYDLITSSGEPAKTKSGRDHILWAAIGLLVAFIARAIPGLIKSIMGF